MLKMDIEGAETDVIADCHDALANVHNVFIEYHSYVDHPQGLASIINTLEKTVSVTTSIRARAGRARW